MKNINFLFAAYSVIWICLCLFLLRIARKLTALEKKVGLLLEK